MLCRPWEFKNNFQNSFLKIIHLIKPYRRTCMSDVALLYVAKPWLRIRVQKRKPGYNTPTQSVIPLHLGGGGGYLTGGYLTGDEVVVTKWFVWWRSGQYHFVTKWRSGQVTKCVFTRNLLGHFVTFPLRHLPLRHHSWNTSSPKFSDEVVYPTSSLNTSSPFTNTRILNPTQLCINYAIRIIMINCV